MKTMIDKKARFYPWLPKLIVLLFCFQPVLDILSYWQEELQIPFSLSFLPRMLVLLLLVVGGFLLSEHKKVYFVTSGILVAFFACHLYACHTNGFTSVVEDAANYIRVLQLPLTALSMITCLRACREEAMDAIERGIFYSLLILLTSFVVSVVTGTEPHTYEDTEVGIRGYCFWPNSQSAILSLSAPIAIAYVIRKYRDRFWLVALTTVLSMAVLYLHGTRLSYFCMVMTGIGMAIVLIITKQPKRYIFLLLGLTAVAVACINFSPMRNNRKDVAGYTEIKENAADSLLILGSSQTRNGVSPVLFTEGAVQPRRGMQAFALRSPLQTSVFADISPNDPRSKYFAYCQTFDLVQSNDKMYAFVPQNYVSKAQVITYAMDIQDRYNGVKDYTKSVRAAWDAIDLDAAEAHGLLMPGVEDYATDIFRADAATILAAVLPEKELGKSCNAVVPADVDRAIPQYAAIERLYQAGIMIGEGDVGHFRPYERLKRGEFAVWLAALIHPDFRRCDEGYMLAKVEAPAFDEQSLDPTVRKDAHMYALYNYFLDGLVGRFGIHNVLEHYQYSESTGLITSEREWKLQFCRMLMEESTPISRVFGLEVGRMAFNGESNNVENDFHGIYFLYGWVGLALMLLFIGYFLVRILLALLRDFKNTFTLQAGGLGIALLTLLMHAYFTCGVLQRANVLFYFGTLLAAVYYLVVLKKEQV